MTRHGAPYRHTGRRFCVVTRSGSAPRATGETGAGARVYVVAMSTVNRLRRRLALSLLPLLAEGLLGWRHTGRHAATGGVRRAVRRMRRRPA